MQNNKIIRRCGVLKENFYDQVTADLCELFSGFEGVTYSEVEDINGVAEPYTLISFDNNGKLYIRIDSDLVQGAVISVHLGNGNIHGRDYVDLQLEGSSSSSMVSYSFARTPYGAVVSVPSYSDSRQDSVSDAQLRLFFSTFEDEEGDDYYGFVYCNASGFESVSNLSLTICTSKHEYLEVIFGASLFVGTLANHNVLCNAFSYTEPLVSSRLYKKLQSEGYVFGKVKIGGKMLIAGSAFALECVEE